MSEYVRQVKQPAKPLASRLGKLDIELTERCNSRCIHCYINQPEDNPDLNTPVEYLFRVVHAMAVCLGLVL